jgi:hypothetical protein
MRSEPHTFWGGRAEEEEEKEEEEDGEGAKDAA